MSFNILGTGFYVPEKTVTNNDLTTFLDTSDEWITQRVGVKERHISENETAADFALKASVSALDASGVKPEELDLIIAATISSDSVCPTVASIVQRDIGADCPAFDINSACSGFIYALDIADAYFKKGGIKNILVVGAERLSRLIDWSDRSTCVIFGDGAGAFVLTEGDSLLASTLYTKGGDDVLSIPNDIGGCPFYKKERKNPYLFMDGQETFKFAVNRIVEDIRCVAEKAGISLNDIDYVVPHQANIRIIDYASKRLGIPKEKFFVNIEKYGNTSSASVPIAFSELDKSGKLKKGDIVVMSAFGGGLSSAACLIRI